MMLRFNSKVSIITLFRPMPRFLDAFTLALLATVAVATLLPCSGDIAAAFNLITNLAIALLFFLHGAKLSREAVVAGASHWRLHLVVLGCTFLLFPALGLLLQPVLQPLLTPQLYLGILYLCMLPSTVQSSIAFTSMAQGNVPAAICSATASNILGIFITPCWSACWWSSIMAPARVGGRCWTS